MPDSRAGHDEIQRMQAGVRGWVRRAARHGEHGLKASPTVLLSLLCASAVSPVVAAGAGVTDAVAVASVGLVSSVGGGVLSTVISDALDRMRERCGKTGPSPEDLEEGIAGQIQEILSAGGADAKALRDEIAGMLKSIDAGETALRAAIDAGSEQVRRDVIAVLGELGDGFAELRFLLGGVERAAGQIQAAQDAQGAQLRTLIEQVGWAGTEARLAREAAAAWRDRQDGKERQDPRWAGECPYRGLLPFTEAEAGVFYGRERLTAELAGRLSRLPAGAAMVIVTGASGAGKSSLLRAGLLPALARGLQLPGSQDWPRIVMTPAGQPLAELAACLAALGGPGAAAILDDLSADPGNAHLAVRQAVIADTARRRAQGQVPGGDGARLVLMVDQFEQVFTSGPGESREAGRQAFITALCAAATCPAGPGGEPPALVVLAVRSDYWDLCAAYPQLAGALQESNFVVGPMTETELRLAITGPAEAAGLRAEGALVGAVLSDLRSAGSAAAPGALPLLSQAMLLTWENRDGDRLTGHGYSQSGGIARAVQASADAVYDALPADRQQLARELLTRMTAAGSGGRVTRREVSRAYLHEGHPGTQHGQIDAILEAFAAKRLLVLGDGTAEISHDALLDAWPRLRSWLEEDKASLILHSQLAEDAAAWLGHGKDSSYLYRGTLLAAVRQGAARWSADPGRYPALTSTERDFLHASARAASRASRQRRIVSAVLVLLVIASLAGTGIAVDDAATARQQTALATSSRLVVQSEALDSTDPVTASLLAAAAWRIDPGNPLARESLLEAYAQPDHAVLDAGVTVGMAFSPDGQTLATADNENIRLWNVATRTQTGAITVPGGAIGVAFSPNGQTLATAGEYDGTVRLWNVATRTQTGAITVPGGAIGVAFSPNGQTLATADLDGPVRLWNLATRSQANTIAVPSGNGNEVSGVAFSPDGQTLATADNDGNVRLWNVATRTQTGAITVPGGAIGVAFSPNGQTLATADNGNVRLWNVAARTQTGTITVPGGAIGVAFSPNGQTLATAGEFDGPVRLWDIATYTETGAVPSSASGVAFSPNGQTLATADDGNVRLWNVAARTQTGTITDPGEANGMAFSPSGQTLATADDDGNVRLWDIAARTQTGTITAFNPGKGPIHVVVAFSPNGQTLAAADGGNVLLFDVLTRARTGTVTDPASASGVAFSPDGQTLATADDDGNVRLWNVAARTQTGTITVPGASESSVAGVAFSPNGQILATAGSDGNVRLWDVATHSQIGTSITVPGRASDTIEIAFSPNGQILATAGSDGNVRLWDVAFPANLLNAVCAIAGRSLTLQEWNADVQSEPFQRVCP